MQYLTKFLEHNFRYELKRSVSFWEYGISTLILKALHVLNTSYLQNFVTFLEGDLIFYDIFIVQVQWV